MSADLSVAEPVGECIRAVGNGKPGLWGMLRGMMGRLHLTGRANLSDCEGGDSQLLPPAAFDEIFASLEKDKAVLNGTGKEIEERFLEMGASVQELSSLSNLLVAQSEKLASTSGSEFKTRLLSGFDVIRQQLEFVGQYQELNAQLLEQLGGYLSKLQKLAGCEDSLDRILSPMKTVCVLFKIHSVDLENEEKSFFESLTDEIVSLQRQARLKFSEQMHGLHQTGEALSDNIPELQEQAAKQGERVRQKKQSIEHSMEALQRQFEEMQECHKRLSESGRELKSASSGAVLGLQYQDITRQKWEHVAQALGEMGQRSRGSSVLSGDQMTFLRDVSLIQIRQLEAIRNDLSQSQSTVSKSVNAMLERLRGMDSQCQQICGKQEGSAAVESLVDEMLDALAEARVWVAELAETSRMTSDVVSSFDKTASDVSGTLRQLSISIGMTALNAQVQVARIGHENGLDVLSEFICSSSTEINRFSRTIGADLDSLVGDLHGTIQQCRDAEEKTRQRLEWLQNEERVQKTQLEELRNVTVAVQNEVSESLGKVHDQASAALEHADFHRCSQQGFEQMEQTLKRCLDLACEGLGEEAGENLHVHVHTLKQSYTMDSERQVFEAAVQEKQKAAVAKAVTAAPSFDKRSQDGAQKTVTDRKNDEAKPPIPQPVVPPKSEPVAASSPAGDLGDNVELF